jgi:hypothetical protein
MRKNRLLVGIGILVIAGIGAARPTGDFSDGNTGFSTGYQYSPGSLWGEATYDVTTNPHNDHSLANSYGDTTTGDGMMLAVNGSHDSSAAAWSQTVSVTAGTDYLFAGELSSWSQGYGPIARLEMMINGTVVGEVDAPIAGGSWEQFIQTWNSGGATSATLSIFDLETAPGGNDFSLDDLSLRAARGGHVIADIGAAPAPAPMFAGMIGFILIGAMKMKRRVLALV